jgi:hypothetical protein
LGGVEMKCRDQSLLKRWIVGMPRVIPRFPHPVLKNYNFLSANRDKYLFRASTGSASSAI